MNVFIATKDCPNEKLYHYFFAEYATKQTNSLVEYGYFGVLLFGFILLAMVWGNQRIMIGTKNAVLRTLTL